MAQRTPTNAPNRPELDRLLKEAAKRPMTTADWREQRISFVYGQMMNCAPHLTKDDVRRIDAEMRGEYVDATSAKPDRRQS